MATNKTNRPDHWEVADMLAIENPRRGYEAAFCHMLKAVAEYRQAYDREFDDGVATDGVLGTGIARILSGARALLDGSTGRLDASRMWGRLEAEARACGWADLDEVEREAR